MKKIALLGFAALLSGMSLMAQDTSLNKQNNSTNPTFDTSSNVPNSNNTWNKDKDKDKDKNDWNKDKNKMKNKKKNNYPDSSGTGLRPDSLRRDN